MENNFDLLDALVSSYPNRRKSNEVVAYILKNPEYFDDLMGHFFSEDLRICQMASFPINRIAGENIELLEPYLAQMIEHYPNAPHDAYKRNVMRLLQFVRIPKELDGKVFDLSLREYCNTKLPTAIRVFATSVLVNICEKHTELKQELEQVLMDYKNTGTTGFENRLAKEIIRLQKI